MYSAVVVQTLALALAVAVGFNVATLAVILSRLAGLHLASSLARGGAAFGATMALALALMSQLRLW